jgi:hypothetical protein
MMRFEKGGAYFAIPADPNLPKRVMVCLGRDGYNVTLGRIGSKLYRPEVMHMCGREVVQIDTEDCGVVTVSCASEADLQMAASVMEAMG